MSSARPFGAKRSAPTGGTPSSCSVFRHWPLSGSQKRTRPSKEAEASVAPSGWKATAVTGSLCAWMARAQRACRRSQRRTDSSKEPEASSELRGEKATHMTKFAWPRSARQAWRPAATSHTHTLPSSEAEATKAPSGLQATSDTPALWPSSTLSARATGSACGGGEGGGGGSEEKEEEEEEVAAAAADKEEEALSGGACGAQSRTLRSAPHDASVRPSGEKRTAATARVWPRSARHGAKAHEDEEEDEEEEDEEPAPKTGENSISISLDPHYFSTRARRALSSPSARLLLRRR